MGLTAQDATFESIKALCSNYKKDSASRKTESYLQQRLTKLEQLWEEFEHRHITKLEVLEDKSNINYFTNKVYEKTKQLYESTKSHMKELLFAQQRQKESFDVNLIEILQDKADVKTKELMAQQEARFKALKRAMTKIDLEFITEKWELEDCVSTLKTKWDCIEKIHWELEGALKDQSFKDEYMQKFEYIENRYDSIRKALNSKIWSNAHFQRSQQLPTIQQPNAYNLKRMHGNINESLNGLANMGAQVSSWGPIIVHYMSQKLDTVTLNEYVKKNEE